MQTNLGTYSGCFHIMVTSKQTAWQFFTNTLKGNDFSANALGFSISSLFWLPGVLPQNTWLEHYVILLEIIRISI